MATVTAVNAAAAANQPAAAAPGTIDAMFGAILDAVNSGSDASGAVTPLATSAQPIANGAAASLMQNTAIAGIAAAVTPDVGIALASNTVSAAALPGWIATLKNTPTTADANGTSTPDAQASPADSATPDPSLAAMILLQAAAQISPQQTAPATQTANQAPDPQTGSQKSDTAATAAAIPASATASPASAAVNLAGATAATNDTSDASDNSDTTPAATPDSTQAAAPQVDVSQTAASQLAVAAVPPTMPQQSAPQPEQIAPLNAAAGVTQKTSDPSNSLKGASDGKASSGSKPRADASKSAVKPGDAAAVKTGDASANDKIASKTDNTVPVQAAQPDTVRHDAAAKDTAKPDVAPQTTPAKTDGAAAPVATAAPAQLQEAQSVATDVHVSAQHHDSEVSTGLDKLGVTIAAKTAEGLHEFDIRLDPPDLGRMQVKLTVDDSGQAQASLVVDKPQTLDLLQRDAASLNRALTDAGLNLSGNGLSFSLREQQQQQSGSGAAKGKSRSLSATAALAASPAGAAGSYAPNSVRLDIRV